MFVSGGDNQVRRGSADVIAGGAAPGFFGDGKFSSASLLDGPSGMAALSDGRILIADKNNHRIRVLTPVTLQRLDLVSGNGQTVPVGGTIVNPLAVRAVLSGGAPLPGATVVFVVQSGHAKLRLS